MLRNRQAEARSHFWPLAALRREERVEDVWRGRALDADARVDDVDLDGAVFFDMTRFEPYFDR